MDYTPFDQAKYMYGHVEEQLSTIRIMGLTQLPVLLEVFQYFDPELHVLKVPVPRSPFPAWLRVIRWNEAQISLDRAFPGIVRIVSCLLMFPWDSHFRPYSFCVSRLPIFPCDIQPPSVL